LDQRIEQFGTRLRLILGDEPITSFAKKCDLGESLIRKYLSGGSLPGLENLVKMGKAGKVSIEWLATGEGPMQNGIAQSPSKSYPASTNSEAKDLYFLMVLGFEKKGEIRTSLNMFFRFVMGFSQEWLKREFNVEPDNISCYHIIGDFLEPTFKNSEIIIVDHREESSIQEGLYMINMDGFTQIKRIQRTPGNNFKLISLNPAYEPITINQKDLSSNINIIGRVIWSGKKL